MGLRQPHRWLCRAIAAGWPWSPAVHRLWPPEPFRRLVVLRFWLFAAFRGQRLPGPLPCRCLGPFVAGSLGPRAPSALLPGGPCRTRESGLLIGGAELIACQLGAPSSFPPLLKLYSFRGQCLWIVSSRLLRNSFKLTPPPLDGRDFLRNFARAFNTISYIIYNKL